MRVEVISLLVVDGVSKLFMKGWIFDRVKKMSLMIMTSQLTYRLKVIFSAQYFHFPTW